MTTQTTLLPITESERLATIRQYLAEQCERRAKAADAAIAKSREADDMLATFDAAMVARPQIITATLETMDGPRAEGECIGGFVEPPDTGTVFVSGPAVEPVPVNVYSRTRFAALVYAYAEQVGIADPDLAEWEVVANDGLPIDSGAVIGAQFYGEPFAVERVTP